MLTEHSKSHQNKFHAQTLRYLTIRFSNMREGDCVTAADKELWEYFATLYKNSNKGIKGRGKDRKIAGDRQQASPLGDQRYPTGSGYRAYSPTKTTSEDGSGRSEDGGSRHGAYDFNEGPLAGAEEEGRELTFADRKMF